MNERIAQARARLAAIEHAERNDPRLEPRYLTRAWIPDEPAAVAVLLLHGITNCPVQYDVLAPQLAARGHAVVVPRMPYHGYRDRMTTEIAALTAEDLEAAALRGLAIAALAGERVVALGISVGATQAGWLAARTTLDTAIAIAPFCGLKELYGGMNDAFGAALRTAPNRFLWWDPRLKTRQPPHHGYPRFSTHALGQALKISTDLGPVAGVHGRRVILTLNDNEPIVNNAFAARRFAELGAGGVAIETVTLHGLPKIHDIIEPVIPQARTDLVYPRLIELIESR
ncbi:MAG TPA: alpha/beta fold hydrolase [Candidatus Elarobacter sp.]